MNTPFPVDVLPEPCRQFVTEASSAIGCDASYVALPLLAVGAGVIGNARSIRLKQGWTEPAVIWGAIVGESGQQKSPAVDAVLRPLHVWQAAALLQHEQALDQFDRDRAIHDADYRAWQTKGRKAGEPPPQKPRPPVCPRVIVSDCTVEALAVLLAENPRGLLLARDELAGWIRGFDQYKGGRGGDVAHWLTMHGARPMVVDRKSGDRRIIHVPRAAVSICGGIQPGTLARVLGQDHFEDGLAARLLLTFPAPRVRRWNDSELSEETQARLAVLFGQLQEIEPDVDEQGTFRPRVLPLTDSGTREWIRFYNEHADEQAERQGSLAAAWSKLEGYAARLGLVVHLIRQVAGDTTLERLEAVDAVSIEAGVILSRWFGREAMRIYTILNESDEERELRRLRDWIAQRGGTTTARNVQNGLRTYRSPGAAEAALNKLRRKGWGQWSPTSTGPKGGHPTRAFRLTTSSDDDTTPLKPEENNGCVDVDATDEPEINTRLDEAFDWDQATDWPAA